jgi:hypothetical protein
VSSDLLGALFSLKATQSKSPSLLPCACSDILPRAVHFEPQAHDWAIGWNHCRQGKGLIGGHFYLSDYGIEMIATEDTAWSWRPKLLHTTGLSNAYPGSPFRLEGMAFITPIRLGVAYARWLARS